MKKVIEYIGYAYVLISLILFLVIIYRSEDATLTLVFAASVSILGALCFLVSAEVFKHKHKKRAVNYSELFDEYKDVIVEGQSTRKIFNRFDYIRQLLREEQEYLEENLNKKFDDSNSPRD